MAAHLNEDDALIVPNDVGGSKVGYVTIHLSRQSQEISISTISILVNAEVANIAMTQRSTEEGIVCTIDLARNPTLNLRPGRNSIEVSYLDRWNQPYYASFLIQLPESGHATAPAPASPVFAAHQRYALVVGIAHYQAQGAGLPNLSYADSDARAFRDFLLSAHGSNFRSDNVQLLLNEEATLANVRAALQKVLSVLTPQDSLVLYLNLHGGYDSTDPGHKYLLTYDSDPRSLANSALPVTELPELLALSANTKHIVLFADTCHSQEIGEGLPGKVKPANLVNQYLVRAAQVQGISALEASDAGQLSLEGSKWKDHGVFSFYLLQGLAGDADKNKDGTVSTSELFSYVRQKVSLDTFDKQLPVASVTPAGNIALAGVLTAHPTASQPKSSR